MGRPPHTGGPAFRFTSNEVVEMEACLLESNLTVPNRDILCSLAEKFSASAERAGKIPVQPKQVWNWFQNRRYAQKAKLIKTPAKLSVSPLPRDDSVRSVSQSIPASSGRNSLDNTNHTEFEARSARDGAWYDVASFTCHRKFDTSDPEVCIRFSGFGSDEDEWVNVRKHVRLRSLPCEASECVSVLNGDLILCFQEGKDQALYFDAHVLDAQRRRHDVRGCRCRFLVRYDHDQSEVGGFMSQRLKHPMVFVMRIALWMLSTWIGTISMCGIPSLSTQFPYVQTFSQVSHKKRQQILASWSSSYFYLLRMLFYALKFMVVLIFFTQVDENNENLSWKAVGYCGPDPAFLSQTKPSKSPHTDEINEEDELYGPLHRGLIDPGLPRQVLAETLKQSGFPLSIHHRKPKPSSISSPSLTLHCDAVVVGSGSGGGVAAGVLAKAGYKVLVLEKGNYYARSSLSLLEGQSVDQMYQGGGLLATKDLSVIVLAGSTVGGGSTINWSASIKTPKHVLNEWCDHYGLEIFKSESYKEAMQVVCDRMGVQSHIHDRESLNNSVLRKGCDELGYPVSNIPRNSPPDHYCGWCCLGCKDGKKKGVAETWLVDMVESGNGLILPGCEALKVLHVRKKATGVAFKFGEDICLVKSKVVIVAGGALGTPALLKNSEMSNANIGKHLHLHPVTMAWGYFPDSVTKSYEGGIMTAMSSVVAEFHGSGYGAIIQTPSLHPGMFSALTPWTSGVNMKERMRKFSKTAHVFALARDVGEGEVSTVSSLSYKIDKRDEKSIQKGLEKVLRILAAAGAEEIGTHHRNGKTLNVKKVSSHVFEKFVKEESGRGIRNLAMPVCSAHQMGSCRMGLDPKTSVVKENGETWEIEGLYLADSSVFPTALGVNPMVTIQAIAYCTAQSVVEVLKRKKKGC